MSTPHVLGRAGQAGRAKNRHAVPFKVFIGYADLPAVRHATAAIGEAVRSRRTKFEIHPMLWRFDQLASPHWAAQAIRAALDAHVVVLASSSPSPLASALENWVDAFLAANRGRRATIVAISGRADAWTISIEHPAPAAAYVDVTPLAYPSANRALAALSR